MADETDDAAVEVVVLLACVALVVEGEPQALVEVRGLQQPRSDHLHVPLYDLEHLRIGREARDRTCRARLLAPGHERRRWQRRFRDRANRARRLSALERLSEDLPFAVDLDDGAFRERVDHRDADAVRPPETL